MASILKFAALLLVLLGHCSAANIGKAAADLKEQSAGLKRQASVYELWNEYKLKYNKKYASDEEEDIRRAIWYKNLQLVLKHNAEADKGLYRYRLGENQLSDRTAEEYKRLLGFRSGKLTRKVISDIEKAPAQPDLKDAPPVPTYYCTVDVSTLPQTVNWTAQGWVTPIQNQGDCGDCWAFSACGSLEGQYYNVTGSSMVMSEQNLFDCSTPEGNGGCQHGGNVDNAFDYVKLNQGIDSASSYPYTLTFTTVDNPSPASCKYNPANNVALITGWMNVLSGSENSLQQAVALVGPISVAINASQDSFQTYTSGVYDPPSCLGADHNLDHAVLAVGYGTTSDGQQYWLLKNSWGVTWGMQGYMMMARNANNLCGISTDASFPTGLQTPLPPAVADPNPAKGCKIVIV